MTQQFSLRRATVDDYRDIAHVYLSSRKALVAFSPLTHSDESINQWVCEVLIPITQVIVAEKSGVIVGFIALSKKEGIGWIEQLYLLPEAIGLGLGTQLVTVAKDTLGSPIRLYSFQENISARKFYERAGFKIIELRDGSKNEELCPDMLYEWQSP